MCYLDFLTYTTSLYIKNCSLLQISVTYRISWRRSRHNFCNSKEDIENKKLVSGEGHLRIRVAPSTGSSNVIPARFVCTDFSIAEDWATGEFTDFKMNYTDFTSSSDFHLG